MAPIRPPNDWAFNLRSALPYYDTDDSDDELPQASISEEAQLKIDLDLSSRQETVEYKPNPWNIAKINAASRSSASRPPEKTGKDEDESSMINEPRKLKAPKGQIVDAFKKQAERRLSVSAGVNGRVLVPGPHVSILPPVDPKPGTVKKKARVSSTAADHSEARHIGQISTRLLAIPSSSSARHHPALNNTKHQIQMNICASDSAFVSRGLNSPKPISNSVPRSKLNFKSFSSPVQTPALISAAHFPPNGGHANKRPLQGYFPLSSPVRPTYGVSASAFTSAASKNDFAFLPQSDLDPNPDVLVPQQEPEQPQSYFRSNPASSSRTCADGTGDHGDALYMQLFDGARGGIPTNLSYDDAHEKDGGNLQGLATHPHIPLSLHVRDEYGPYLSPSRLAPAPRLPPPTYDTDSGARYVRPQHLLNHHNTHVHTHPDPHLSQTNPNQSQFQELIYPLARSQRPTLDTEGENDAGSGSETMPQWLVSALPPRTVVDPVPVGISVPQYPAADNTANTSPEINNNTLQYPSHHHRQPRSPILLPLLSPRTPRSPARVPFKLTGVRSRSPTKASNQNKRRPSRSPSPSHSSEARPKSRVVPPANSRPPRQAQANIYTQSESGPYAYASIGNNPDAEWSTLPPRKKAKAQAKLDPVTLERSGIRQSGRFRIPGLVGGANRADACNEGKRARVVKYLPPPMGLPNKENVNAVAKQGRIEQVGADVETPEGADGRGRDTFSISLNGRQPQDPQQQQKKTYSNVDLSDRYHNPLSSPPGTPACGHSSPTVVNLSSPSSDVCLPIDVDDIMNKYPHTRVLMSERKRAAAQLWELLDLDSCVVDTIHRDSEVVAVDGVVGPRMELSIIVWDG